MSEPETDIKVGDFVRVYDEIKVEILLIKDGNYYFFDPKEELKFTTIENLKKVPNGTKTDKTS